MECWSPQIRAGYIRTPGLLKSATFWGDPLCSSALKAILPTSRGRSAKSAFGRARAPELQIRVNMFKKLTGKEEGLAGLWNFADASANDASSAAHHGKLVGQAKVVEAALPTEARLFHRAFVQVTLTEAGGRPAPVGSWVALEKDGVTVDSDEADSFILATTATWRETH